MKKIVWFITKYIYGVLCTLYLYTFGILFAKNRDLISSMTQHFGLGVSKQQQEVPILQRVGYSSLVEDTSAVKIRQPLASRGNVTLLELWVINSLIQKYKPNRLFEIGTFDGRTTLNMAANSPEDAEVYTLDLPKAQMDHSKLGLEARELELIDKEASGERFAGCAIATKITQLLGDSGSFDFSPYHNSIDFMFIDGSHAYDYVKNDSQVALKLLREGKGMIVWHDYTEWDGVTRALNELKTSEPRLSSLVHIDGTHLAVAILD